MDITIAMNFDSVLIVGHEYQTPNSPNQTLAGKVNSEWITPQH